MADADRIALVERYRLDVWYHDSTNPSLPPGWVADLGEPDASLWDDIGFTNHDDGGTALATGKPDWRSAVDTATEVIQLLNIQPPSSHA